MSFLQELRRRKVFRLAALYIVGAWVVLQVADLAFESWDISSSALRYVWLAAILGFPVALIFGWRYDITTRGIVRTPPAGAGTQTDLSLRRSDYVILALLVIVTIGVIYPLTVQIGDSRPPQSTVIAQQDIDPNSIAVLPFVNMSDDAGNEYFSDGVSEELLNLLAQIPDLRVISRSSSFSYKNKDLDIPTIAAQLNVAHILEGSVRKSGNQIRITAQLIEARSDTHLWSETYDRELNNIFVVQDEISAVIVKALKERLGLHLETMPRVVAAANTAAYEAYLRGRFLFVQHTSTTSTTIEGAIHEFEKAIALDPDYALAHAELAMALLWTGQNDGMPDTEVNARAAPHAEKAMALDPNLAEAHAAAGSVLKAQWDQWQTTKMEEALMHFERAIQINPNYSIVYKEMAGLLYMHFGRYAEAFAARKTALQLNPLSIPARASYVRALINRNRLNEANHELEKLVSMAPAVVFTRRSELTWHGGQWANGILARLNVLQAYPGSGWTRILLTRRFAAIGLEKEALAIYEKPWAITLSMLGRPADAVTSAEALIAGNPSVESFEGELGVALAAVGDYARARPILEKMWQLSGGLVTLHGLFAIHHAAALIAIRRDAGEERRVGELLAAIRDNVRRFREAGMTGTTAPYVINLDIEEGLAAYLAGEHKRGLSLIAKGAEDGYFILPKEAYLQTLYDDPGFAPILAGQEARQIRERNKFLAVVCNDNPYADVWQPAEGTCERFDAVDHKN